MSQFPQTYPPPTSGYEDPLSPAKRASILMIVLGALMLLYGLCNGMSTFIIDNAQLEKQMNMFSKEPSPFSPQTMRTITVIFSALVMGVGIFMLSTAGPVRRGSSLAITIALIGVIILCAVLGLFTVVMALAGFVMPAAFVGVCVCAIPTALFGLLLVWLFQASRAGGRIQLMQAQYQAQYMQYQQMMQQYGQAGYGYGYPAPPAPPQQPQPQQSQPQQSPQQDPN